MSKKRPLGYVWIELLKLETDINYNPDKLYRYLTKRLNKWNKHCPYCKDTGKTNNE